MSQVNRPEVIAFLNAIKEEPDDNSLRLILADYLEERDDPRGTFLRCETEIASMDRFDDRIWDFKKQRDELWSLHRNEWLGSFASYVNHATLRDDEQSSRGLLAVEMSKQRLLDPTTLSLANSEIWSWVDELRTKLNRNNILGLDDLGLLSHLATLDLSGSMLRRVGASALAKTSFLSNVRRLILADCELTTAGLDSLLASRRLTELATLDLSQNELRPPSFEVLSQADLQLDELILQDNQLNFAGMSELVKASWMEGLRSFDLSRNYLSGDTLTPIVAC